MQNRAAAKWKHENDGVDPTCKTCLGDQLKPLGQITPCRSCRNPIQKRLWESDNISDIAGNSEDVTPEEALRIELMEKLVHAMRSGTDESSKALLRRLRQGISIEELVATLPVVQSSNQEVATVVREVAKRSGLLDEPKLPLDSGA